MSRIKFWQLYLFKKIFIITIFLYSIKNLENTYK